MFTARITRQRGERVVKDEIFGDSLFLLLTEIFMTYDNDEVLEIHIIRQEVEK